MSDQLRHKGQFITQKGLNKRLSAAKLHKKRSEAKHDSNSANNLREGWRSKELEKLGLMPPRARRTDLGRRSRNARTTRLCRSRSRGKSTNLPSDPSVIVNMEEKYLQGNNEASTQTYTPSILALPVLVDIKKEPLTEEPSLLIAKQGDENSCLDINIKSEILEMDIPYSDVTCKLETNEELIIKDEVDCNTTTGAAPKKIYNGSECNYESVESSYLKRHAKIHTEEKPFKCTQCYYKCVSRSVLCCHIKTHTGEKPFECDMCSYKSSQSGNLKRHLKIHVEEKSFKCSVCGYVSVTKRKLIQHIQTHSEDKPFECNMCDYKAYQQVHLKQHIRIHTGEKSYKCAKCNYRSIRNSDVARHILTHSADKPFNCNFCDYKCIQKRDLMVHVKTHSKLN